MMPLAASVLLATFLQGVVSAAAPALPALDLDLVPPAARCDRALPAVGRAHYALAISYRTLRRREDAQQALTRHAEYGPRWPGLDDPVLDAVTAVPRL